MTYRKIPGWLTKSDGDVLKSLTRLVPENGNILEIGSFIGRSTCCIVEDMNKTIKLHCVDSWDHVHKNDFNIPKLIKDFDCSVNDIFPCEEKFIKNIHKYNSNIIIYKKDIKNFRLKIKFDLIFLDALYTESYTKEVIKFYFLNLNSNGIFSGHDYDDEFPYKVQCINELAEELNQKVIVSKNSSVWYFKKKD